MNAIWSNKKTWEALHGVMVSFMWNKYTWEAKGFDLILTIDPTPYKSGNISFTIQPDTYQIAGNQDRISLYELMQSKDSVIEEKIKNVLAERYDLKVVGNPK